MCAVEVESSFRLDFSTWRGREFYGKTSAQAENVQTSNFFIKLWVQLQIYLRFKLQKAKRATKNHLISSDSIIRYYVTWKLSKKEECYVPTSSAQLRTHTTFNDGEARICLTIYYRKTWKGMIKSLNFSSWWRSKIKRQTFSLRVFHHLLSFFLLTWISSLFYRHIIVVASLVCGWIFVCCPPPTKSKLNQLRGASHGEKVYDI